MERCDAVSIVDSHPPQFDIRLFFVAELLFMIFNIVGITAD